MKIVDAVYGRTFKCDNDVAFGQATAPRGSILFDTGYQDSLVLWSFMVPNQSRMNRDVLSCQTKVTSPDFSVPNQQSRNQLRGIGGNRKAEPLRGQNHCCVHADHRAGGVYQRTTGIAG